MINIASLTEEQLRGETCVRCGRVPLEATKIHHEDIDLIVCADRHARVCAEGPFWLAQPCPSWCDGRHHDCDSRENRAHMSAWRGSIPLALEQGVMVWNGLPFQPEHVSLYLIQRAYEREPRIWCGKGDSTNGWHMTPAEARELVATIITAIDLAAQTCDQAPSATLNQQSPPTPAKMVA